MHKLIGEATEELIGHLSESGIPTIGHIGLTEFHRAEEAIRIGYETTKAQLVDLKVSPGQRGRAQLFHREAKRLGGRREALVLDVAAVLPRGADPSSGPRS